MNTTKKNSDRSFYDKKVLSIAQYLHPYIKHRLYIAESMGILPKNLYCSNDIVDESLIKLYKQGFDVDADVDLIKLKLFKITDNDLDALFDKEAFHKNTISTNRQLEEELQLLEENYTVDGDRDYVMNEELDDISYHLNDSHNENFVFDDHNNKILNALDLSPNNQKAVRSLVGSFYNWLPIRVSNIVDLHVFGQLSFDEISKIKPIEVSRIESILTHVKKRFATPEE